MQATVWWGCFQKQPQCTESIPIIDNPEQLATRAGKPTGKSLTDGDLQQCWILEAKYMNHDVRSSDSYTSSHVKTSVLKASFRVVSMLDYAGFVQSLKKICMDFLVSSTNFPTSKRKLLAIQARYLPTGFLDEQSSSRDIPAG